MEVMVRGENGLCGWVEQTVGNLVHIRLDNNLKMVVDKKVLEPGTDGSLRLPMRYDAHGNVVLPVYHESMNVEKRSVETARIAITKTVHEYVQRQRIPLAIDEVQIERVPMNTPVHEPYAASYNDNTWVVPLFEEVLIVKKQWFLKEEIRATIRRETIDKIHQVTLRKDEVSINKTNGICQKTNQQERQGTMSTMVIGFSTDRAEAETAVKELETEGFEPAQIHIYEDAAEPSELRAAGLEETTAEDLANKAKNGGAVVTVKTSDEKVNKAVEIMERHHVARTDQATKSEKTTASQTSTGGKEEIVVPIVSEEMRVGKRQMESGGVRIHTEVKTEPVERQINLKEEHVNVERRPADRPASSADQASFKEGTVEFVEAHEEPLVTKNVRVVEEVVVSKDVSEHQETIRDQIRKTEIAVERIGEELSRETHDDWTKVEPQARRRWEESHEHGTWDKVKDNIRGAWERIRGKK